MELLRYSQSSVTHENVNSLDGDDMTRLYRICWDCSNDTNMIVEQIKSLIHLGANVNLGRMESKIQTTPLWIASARGLEHIVTVLIEAGARADLWDTLTDTLPIHVAATSGPPNILLMLLKAYPASVFTTDGRGMTALHRATGRGLVESCRALLMAGSHVNALDDRSEHPIFYYRNEEVIRLLLDFGFSPPRGAFFMRDGTNCAEMITRRNCIRATSLAMIQLRRRRAISIGRNGRDLLRIVAQFIWSQRNL